MGNHWTLQDAKNKFSAVVEAALSGAPQEVTRRGRPAVVVLSVADRGPGLPPRARQRVFDRFYKADAARTRGAVDDSGQGSGLGTAIALENARLHGGTIEAADAPGGGALFTLRLPLRGTPEGTE